MINVSNFHFCWSLYPYLEQQRKKLLIIAIKPLIITQNILQRWKDEFLVWDSREYNDIKEIDISSKAIWRPDFQLYNA